MFIVVIEVGRKDLTEQWWLGWPGWVDLVLRWFVRLFCITSWSRKVGAWEQFLQVLFPGWMPFLLKKN